MYYHTEFSNNGYSKCINDHKYGEPIITKNGHKYYTDAHLGTPTETGPHNLKII
jgi:hypothetical protein